MPHSENVELRTDIALGLPKTAESPLPEPMPLVIAGLSPAEWQYSIDTKSCQYCGTLRNFVSSCPLKKPGSPVGARSLVGHMENVPASPACTPFHAILLWGDQSKSLRVLFDSGADESFLGATLGSELNIPSPFPWT